MTWVKVDDRANEHQKQVDAGGLACWLWACGLMFCNRQKKKNGFIPLIQVRTLYAPYSVSLSQKLASKLVEVGLWEEADGGYVIHDYAEYQACLTAGLSEKRALAGRLGGIRSGKTRKQLASPNEANSEASLLPGPEATDEAMDARARAHTDARRALSLSSDQDPEIKSEQEVSAERGGVEGAGGTPEAAAALQADEPTKQPAEPAYKLGERVFAELWAQAHGGEQYTFVGGVDTSGKGDIAVLCRAAQLSREACPKDPEAYLRHKVKGYLADDGGGKNHFFDEQRHPAKFLTNNWNKYGVPSRRPLAGPRNDDPPPARAMSPGDVAKRSAGILAALPGQSAVRSKSRPTARPPAVKQSEGDPKP